MEYFDQSYINLFKQVQDEPLQNIEQKNYSYEQIKDNSYDSYSMLKGNQTQNYTSLNESPKYNQSYQNLNEYHDNSQYQNFNLNEFKVNNTYNDNFEAYNANEVFKQQKQERLNEVMKRIQQERLNEVMKTESEQNINEKVNFNNDIITIEMFEKARVNSMLSLNKIISSKTR